MKRDFAATMNPVNCLLLAVALPTTAFAADIRNLFRKAEDGKVIRCESRAMETNLCKADVSGGVHLLRQLSKTQCVENRNWRGTRDGIQVSGGCRADFNLGPPKKVYGNQVLICESVGHRWKLCSADTRDGVRLARQLSDTSACIRNQTWGVRNEGVWVASGCRAEFRIGAAEEPVASGVPARITRCDSENGMRKRCRIDTGKGVRLVQKISSSPCTYGSTWGFDDDEIWVRRGCRAEFQIDIEPRDIVAKPQIPANAALVRCESEDNQPRRCPIPAVEHIQVKEQLSNKSCVEGKSWRTEQRTIVVKSGCRAVFAVW